MAVRKYFVVKENDENLYEIRTERNIPRLFPLHGIVCKRCYAMYPEDGTVDSAMQMGCGCCGSFSFANVYESRDV